MGSKVIAIGWMESAAGLLAAAQTCAIERYPRTPSSADAREHYGECLGGHLGHFWRCPPLCARVWFTEVRTKSPQIVGHHQSWEPTCVRVHGASRGPGQAHTLAYRGPKGASIEAALTSGPREHAATALHKGRGT